MKAYIQLVELDEKGEDLFWENFNEVSSTCFNSDAIYCQDFYLYQKEYCISNKTFVSDKSFIIKCSDEIVCAGLFLLTKKIDNKNYEINFGNNFPGILLISKNMNNKSIQLLIERINYFNEIANKIIFTIPRNNKITKGYETIFNKFKFNQEIRWTKSINTNKKKEILWSDIRKSYKSPINKGLKEQTFQVIDYLNLDYDKFKLIQDLHFKISGRKTRSNKSWDLQYASIKNDNSFAFISFDEKKNDLLSAVYFYKSNHHAYYGTGLYTEESKKNLYGYSLIWKAILYCIERGINLCELDDNVKFNWMKHFEKKQINISFLKSGFGGDLKPRLIFSIKR